MQPSTQKPNKHEHCKRIGGIKTPKKSASSRKNLLKANAFLADNPDIVAARGQASARGRLEKRMVGLSPVEREKLLAGIAERGDARLAWKRGRQNA